MPTACGPCAALCARPQSQTRSLTSCVLKLSSSFGSPCKPALLNPGSGKGALWPASAGLSAPCPGLCGAPQQSNPELKASGSWASGSWTGEWDVKGHGHVNSVCFLSGWLPVGSEGRVLMASQPL